MIEKENSWLIVVKKSLNGIYAMAALAKSVNGDAQKPKKVLVVDDHFPSGKVESALIRELGYKCDTVTGGVEALERLAENRYDLVMLDIQMPGLDGVETAQRMRALEKKLNLPPTPIIGMTGRATDDDKLICLKAGMNDYLSKPFRLEDLQKKLSFLGA